MDQRDALITRARNGVLTGLGVLLGAGQISSETHEKVLALLDAADAPVAATIVSSTVKPVADTYPRAGKDTPISLASNDLMGGIGNLTIDNKHPQGPLLSPIPLKQPAQDPGWSRTTTASGSLRICPWYCTPGYRCRDKDCPWLHEDVEGAVKEPLICTFWADGQRCNKSDDECRFAHHWAQHRQIAPNPRVKFKKTAMSQDRW